jgi:hypothetical protein
MSALSLAAAQREFTAHLSAVEDAVSFAFRKRLRRQEYEEALAEARAAAWSAWHGLIAKGKDPLEVGVRAIAHNACRHVRNGRRLGNAHCGRGAMDIQHPRVRHDSGLRVLSFEEADRDMAGSWREWLAEDNCCSPADQAAFRLDFEGWLASLPMRKRQVAELLAEGHEGAVVATEVGVSPGRVSQLRTELQESWEVFQRGTSDRPGRGAGADGRRSSAALDIGTVRRRVAPALEPIGEA